MAILLYMRRPSFEHPTPDFLVKRKRLFLYINHIGAHGSFLLFSPHTNTYIGVHINNIMWFTRGRVLHHNHIINRPRFPPHLAFWDWHTLTYFNSEDLLLTGHDRKRTFTRKEQQ